ncbi:MAG: hypothetical protein MUF49_31665 [Oculatellaceae cyanobacterium Prado106]|jgi:hypothetical protein|nr:hypothetical protein [Oculatellaceae cyanobacterium Prado106]
MSEIQVILALMDAEDDADRLQASAQNLLPLLREVEGIEEVGLFTEAETPDGSKSFGAIVPGALKFLVENSQILQGVAWVGDRLINGRTLKMKVKAPNGSEVELEAKSREDFDYQLQQAIAFCNQNR